MVCQYRTDDCGRKECLNDGAKIRELSLKLHKGTNRVAHGTVIGNLTEFESHDPSVWRMNIQQGSIQGQILMKLFREKQFTDKTVFDDWDNGIKGFFIQLLLNLMLFMVIQFMKSTVQG